MTPEDIDKLTIAEVRAIAERASAALSQLRELGLLPGALMVPRGVRLTHDIGPPGDIVPAPPYPCPGCGRSGPEAPGERASETECLQCGNHLPLVAGAPGVVMTNKGPMARISAAERAAALGQPAFDASGEPT